MTQIKTKEELAGKTIKRIAFSGHNQCFLFFTDESFCIIIGSDYEVGVELEIEDYNLNPAPYNINELRDIGILSQQQFKALEAKFEEQDKEDTKTHELNLLAELKQKYPNH